MPLSDTKLRNIEGKPYSGNPELSDRDGLSVRISKKGTIAWQYRFRFNNKPARLTLGRYPDLGLKAARELIPDIRNILSDGIDPRLGWKESNKNQAAVTAEDCTNAFLEKRAKKLKPSYQGLYKSVCKNHFSQLFKGQAIDRVSHDEWLEWFDEISEANPKLAGSLLKSGKAIFRWCKRRKMIGHIELLNIQVDDIGIPPDIGERVLTLNECGEIWKAISQTGCLPSTKNCIRLCMLFACRQGEIRNAERNHFDMKEMIWTVPKELSKTNKPIRRPITKESEKIIRELWDIYGEQGFLIPAVQQQKNPASASVINTIIRRMRARLVKEGKITAPFVSHDFRRTLSTRLSECDIMPHVTEKMLGHELTGVMKIYNKHDWLDDQRKAYELWGEKILSAAKKE